jgi:hypothetical protein
MRSSSGIVLVFRTLPVIQRRFRLEQQDVCFLVCHGHVLHATRNHDEFPLFDLNLPALEAHPQPALHHEEQFVLGVVMVPHERALQFYEFDVGVIDFAGDLGAPMLLKQTEFLAQVHFFHAKRLAEMRNRQGNA